MKFLVSHPELAPGLVSALNETDCLAARTAPDTVDVFAIWLADDNSTAQAAMELLFFIKAWASNHPEFQATLLDARYAPRWGRASGRRRPS